MYFFKHVIDFEHTIPHLFSHSSVSLRTRRSCATPRPHRRPDSDQLRPIRTDWGPILAHPCWFLLILAGPCRFQKLYLSVNKQVINSRPLFDAFLFDVGRWTFVVSSSEETTNGQRPTSNLERGHTVFSMTTGFEPRYGIRIFTFQKTPPRASNRPARDARKNTRPHKRAQKGCFGRKKISRAWPSDGQQAR